MRGYVSLRTQAKGLEHQRNCQLGGSGAYPPFYGVAEKIVLGNVKKALGLEHCKFGFTGVSLINVANDSVARKSLRACMCCV